MNRKSTDFIEYKDQIHVPTKDIAAVNKKAEQCQILIKFPAPNCLNNMYYATTILSNILGADSSSRLFKVIREDYGLVYNISCYLEESPIGGIINIYFATSYENVELALNLIKSELLKIKKYGVKDSEVEFEKQKLKISLLTNSEDSLSCAVGNAVDLFKHHKCFDIEDAVELFMNVTKKQVNDAAKTFLNTSHACFGILGTKVNSKIFKDFELL